jgi:hypothetical protein
VKRTQTLQTDSPALPIVILDNKATNQREGRGGPGDQDITGVVQR